MDYNSNKADLGKKFLEVLKEPMLYPSWHKMAKNYYKSYNFIENQIIKPLKQAIFIQQPVS